MVANDFAIKSDKLCKNFGSIHALKNVRIQVPKGSVYALLGENGAGKTTLMRVLLGLFHADCGTASILNTPLDKINHNSFKKISFVAESQTTPGWMTVENYLNYHKLFYDSWDDIYCKTLVNLLELPLDRRFKNLSRGQRMKAQVIRAASFKPELLLMDEPLSGLDPLVREQVTSVMVELTAQHGSTILVSSHDIDDIEKCSDHCGMLLSGELKIQSEISSLQKSFRLVRAFISKEANQPLNLPNNWTLKTSSKEGFEAYTFGIEEKEIHSFLKQIDPNCRVELIPLSLKESFLAQLYFQRSLRLGGK
jgi:ABC-2 type transport system ATP-binding protein